MELEEGPVADSVAGAQSLFPESFWFVMAAVTEAQLGLIGF